MLKEALMLYSRASKLVKEELRSDGLDPSLYSLHSLRSGGASSAAALEIPDHLFQMQGGWRSTQVKNNYIQQSSAACHFYQWSQWCSPCIYLS